MWLVLLAVALRVRVSAPWWTLAFGPAAFAAWLVPAALVVYLALANGGYGLVERSEIGLPASRVLQLRHQAEIGHGRAVTMTEAAGYEVVRSRVMPI